MRFRFPSVPFARRYAVLPLLAASLLRAQTGTLTLNETVAANAEPSAYEANFTLTATLAPPNGGPAPTGTVTFSVDGAAVGAPVGVTANGANYLVVAPTYSIGSHSISAAYSGDANYVPATVSGTHTIRKLESDVTFIPPTQVIYYGQSISGSGQVGSLESAPDATLNGGTISFYVDGTDVCDIIVSGLTQSCPASAGQGYNSGSHVLTVIYGGNEYYQPSPVFTATFTVIPDYTATSLQTSGSPSLYGQNVIFTSTVTAPYASAVGTVAFVDGASTLGTATLDATGTAVFPISTLFVGTHTITAVYQTSENFSTSTSHAVTQVVTLPPASPLQTVTLLTSSINPSVLGQNVTFTASVATTGAVVQVPTGTVSFNDGGSVIGTGTLDASGNARLSTSTLAVGQHNITASYTASSGFAASSASLVQVVTTSLTSAGNGFLLSVTPSSISVGAGNSVIVNVTVTALNGFSQPVQLSCNGAPSETICNFAQVMIPAGGGTTALAISPSAPHNCGSSTPYFIARGKNTAFPMLAMAGIVLFATRRRLMKGIMLAAVLCMLSTLSGCGIGNCTDLGVKPGTYNFTIQGTSTGSSPLTQSQAVQMTVHI